MSSPPERGAARLLRGACLAALTVGLSAVAHWLGGGHLPPAGMLAGLALLLLPAGVWASGRRLHPVTAGAFLAAGQAGLHAAFSVLMSCAPPGAGATAVSLAGPAGHAGHGAATMVMHCAAAGAGPVRPATGGAAMLAFHAVATLATAFVVGGAGRLARWWADELTACLAPARPLVGPRPHAAGPWRPGVVTGALHLRALATRRGPPRAPAGLGTALA